MSNNKLKILHIIPNLKKGGAERICLDICQELVRTGNHVKLILLEDANEYEELSSGLDIQIAPGRPFLREKNEIKSGISHLKKIVANFQPSAVHTHLFQAEFVWKCANMAIPSFFHIHDNIKVFEPFSSKNSFKTNAVKWLEKRRYFKLLYNSNTTYLCISKDTESYVRNHLDSNKINIKLLHNAINYSRFHSKIQKQLNSFHLISIGSLVPKKGHLFLIDVINHLKSLTDKKIFFQILGDGPLKPTIANRVKELGLLEEIQLLGKVNQPEEFLKSANLYIHGATEEPFGLVLLEAMAAGLPVICLNGGGNKDIMENGENGFCFDRASPEEFAAKIIATISDEEQYFKMSQYAKVFAEKYDIKGYTQDLIHLYKSVIK